MIVKFFLNKSEKKEAGEMGKRQQSRLCYYNKLK